MFDTDRRKRRRTGFSSRAAILAITLVVGLLAVTVGIRSSALREKDKEYALREENVSRQLQEEELRTEELNRKKKYVSTYEYYKEVAKEKLRLIEPDEMIMQED